MSEYSQPVFPQYVLPKTPVFYPNFSDSRNSDSNAFGYWSMNVQDGTGSISDAWKIVRGCSEISEESFETIWFKSIHTEDYDAVQIALNAYLQGKTPLFFAQFRVRNDQKSWTWIRSIGLISEWEKTGQPLRIEGFDQDISKEIADSEELKKNQTLLKEVIKISRMGYWLYDYMTNRISIVSDNLRDILGIETGDNNLGLLLDQFEETVHPDDRERIINALFSPTETERKTTCRLINPQGKEVPVLVFSHPTIDEQGRVVGQIAIFQDVTEQRSASRSLEFHRAYLAILAEMRNFYYGRSDREIIADYLNIAAKHFGIAKAWYGTLQENTIRPEIHAGHAKELNDFDRIEVVRSNAEPVLPFVQAIRGRKGIALNHLDSQPNTAEWSAFLKRSRLRSLLVVPVEIQGITEGEIVFYSFDPDTFSDSVAAYLESSVKELTRIITEKRFWEQHQHLLEQAKEKAESAANAKTQFLANMSHEIRTPMTAILGYAEVLTDRFISKESLYDTAVIIQNNAKYLLQILNDILDFSKIEADKMSVDLIGVQLPQLISDIYSPCLELARKKQIELRFQAKTSIPDEITTDPIRIKQILLNLIGNAIKFTTEGSVSVSIYWTAEERENGESPQRGAIRFEIKDTGIGISREQQAVIFSPFNQGDSSTTRKFGGTGLGLAISQRLVNILGGTMSLKSEPGIGSEFTIRLPVAVSPTVQLIEHFQCTKSYCSILREDRSDSDSELKKKPDKTTPLSGIRVLLAEDGRDNQRLFALILTKAGADVTIADNGLLTTKFVVEDELAGTPFHVILMDMQMPIMDGYTAATKLREQGCKVPIVALTAHAMPEERLKCLDCGCDDYATKPILRDALIEVVYKNAKKGKR